MKDIEIFLNNSSSFAFYKKKNSYCEECYSLKGNHCPLCKENTRAIEISISMGENGNGKDEM